MSPAGATKTSSRSKGASNAIAPTGPRGVEASLEPLSEALVTAARARADDLRAAASEDVRRELSRARSEAERILEDGRLQGVAAAEWIATLRNSAARHQARETVLSAQRRALDKLRQHAIDALVDRAGTPEGRKLSDRLSAHLSERLGRDVQVHREGSSVLELVAESGSRRAFIGPEALVDDVLSSMAEVLEGLWA